VRWRARRLRDLSREKRLAFARSRQGSVEEVLVTRACPGTFFGVSSNYLTVQATGHAVQGALMKVRLSGLTGSALRGESL
jgi:tRNA A37 methylthiotransferase MiaB